MGSAVGGALGAFRGQDTAQSSRSIHAISLQWDFGHVASLFSVFFFCVKWRQLDLPLSSVQGERET